MTVSDKYELFRSYLYLFGEAIELARFKGTSGIQILKKGKIVYQISHRNEYFIDKSIKNDIADIINLLQFHDYYLRQKKVRKEIKFLLNT